MDIGQEDPQAAAKIRTGGLALAQLSGVGQRQQHLLLLLFVSKAFARRELLALHLLPLVHLGLYVHANKCSIFVLLCRNNR